MPGILLWSMPGIGGMVGSFFGVGLGLGAGFVTFAALFAGVLGALRVDVVAARFMGAFEVGRFAAGRAGVPALLARLSIPGIAACVLSPIVMPM